MSWPGWFMVCDACAQKCEYKTIGGNEPKDVCDCCGERARSTIPVQAEQLAWLRYRRHEAGQTIGNNYVGPV